MRNEPNLKLDRYRATHPTLGSTPSGMNYGYFVRGPLNIISSGTPDRDEDDPITRWEHVSVSCQNRTPTWEEMKTVKEMFWKDDETVVQFHPRQSEYVNIHEHVLHLWRIAGVNHELPPQECV